MVAASSTAPVPAVDAPEPLAEPRARDWDDDPRTCARYDDHYWDDYEYSRDEDE